MVYKVSEFAKIIDALPQNVYTWGKRNKLVILGGMIDDENPVNKAFLKNRGVKINSDTGEAKKVAPQSSKKHTSIPEDSEEQSKQAAIRTEKLQEEYKYVKLRNLKIEGKLIPTDVVGRSVAEVVARYKTMFVQQTDQLLRDLCNANGISNEILTESISKLTDIANESSKRANIEAKIAIENSISDSLSLLK